jgi:NTE family protein
MTRTSSTDSVALVLGGGGPRGAYQAGVLRGIARRFPDARFPIVTGISAGAINTTFLASHQGTFPEAAEQLVALWRRLGSDQVYDVRPATLAINVLRWGARLISGGMRGTREPMRGMVDTSPLREFLRASLGCASDGSIPGIEANIARGRLRAAAVSATGYSTGNSTTWIQGSDIEVWRRPHRHSEVASITVAHLLASSALPMLFPAVRVGDEWFGDGGIRLTSPLSPALHLGATRILTVSTRHHAEHSARSQPYPPPAQVLGVLYGSVFLDMVEEDISRLQTVNRLLRENRGLRRSGMRIVDILVMRPSRDLRALAGDFEARLPFFLRYLTRGLGTRDTANQTLVSLLMFEQDYLRRLIEIGEGDAEQRADEIGEFLTRRTADAA